MATSPQLFPLPERPAAPALPAAGPVAVPPPAPRRRRGPRLWLEILLVLLALLLTGWLVRRVQAEIAASSAPRLVGRLAPPPRPATPPPTAIR